MTLFAPDTTRPSPFPPALFAPDSFRPALFAPALFASALFAPDLLGRRQAGETRRTRHARPTN